jgi:glycerol-3-phosphate dehydrogenase
MRDKALEVAFRTRLSLQNGTIGAVPEAQMPTPHAQPPTVRCDVLVVGGGINGAGIARDAAGSGYSVILTERDDLASHTSSASTKLIHGGLRYLEHYEFSLVRKALAEREVLLAAAPHITWPLRFVLPHEPHLRPALLIRAGLFLYDHLARRRRLAGSEGINLQRHIAGAALRQSHRKGFVYSDMWVDDARLVVLNAMDARERGAEILTRTACTHLTRDGDGWLATLSGRHARTVRARAVVNAAGPWADRFLEQATPVRPQRGVRLVKGSHIIVPRLFEHEYAYIFQNADRRIVFAIPYEHDYTLIGTTDVEYHGDPATVAIDEEETRYLCRLASEYFRCEVSPADVVHTYSGVRPLLEDESSDPSAVTRDYTLELAGEGAPLLSVFGGKITTYRRLAEEALGRLASALGDRHEPWTARVPLPGGDIPHGDIGAYRKELHARYPHLPARLMDRIVRAYGTRAVRWLGDGAATTLGVEIVSGLYEAELRYLLTEEWACTGSDVLRRRSKLALHLPPDAERLVDDWIARQS